MVATTAQPKPKLFQPARVGNMDLKHRVIMAPLTRFRADNDHVPLPIVKEYYEQRASVPGTLLITEATVIAPKAGGYGNVPGIWSDEQVARWKEIVDAVHAKGSYIYLQLWAIGRTAVPGQPIYKDGGQDHVSASNIPMEAGGPAPRPLTLAEIKEFVESFATGAKNAVERAGFDGVEIHGANGYLVDQFIQDVSNVREDQYGGSIENRARFALEVVTAIAKAVGPKKTAIRLSPWGTFQGMGMKDPVPTFEYLVKQLKKTHPTLSYIHVVEPRVDGAMDVIEVPEGHNNDFIRKIWGSESEESWVVSAGGYTRALGLEFAESKGDLVCYGRPFIANPDLPSRLERDTPLNKADRSTFYVPNSAGPEGYTDYPFAN